MTTFDQSTPPLEIAYLAAKSFTFPDTQIHSLRQVASRYAKVQTEEGLKRSVEILDEARQLHQQLANELGKQEAFEYPLFAVDYESAGKHELALGIVEESIQMAHRLRRKPKISMLIMVADACYSIGEVARCRELLVDVRSYYQDRQRRLSHEDGPFDVLQALYLKLDDVDAARDLTLKMKGLMKANALVAIAFHKKPFWQFEKEELHRAYLYWKRYGYESPMAQIAELITKEGFHLRGMVCYLARIKTPAIAFEATLNVVNALLETGNPTDRKSV